jgi:cyclopropane fatty-acyl-phospholipid synthase-like methyltransferase
VISSQPGKEYWDALFKRPEYVYGTAPNQYLLQHSSLLSVGMKALALGDGEGRNGVWLATQGISVVSIERSSWGINKAKRLARKRRVQLSFECCDLLEWSWPKAEFDLVVAMYLHFGKVERKKVHDGIAACLRPGGFLLLEAFRRNHRADGSRADPSLFTTALLRRDFCGFEFLELLEGTVMLNEGCMHQGQASVVRMLVRKTFQY